MVKKHKQQKPKHSGDAVVEDPRFASMHTAPLFKKQQKDSHKLALDKRFEAVLTDERFQAPQPEYDKYGRKTKKQGKSELGEMYKLEQSAEDRLDYLNKLARGEIEDSGSDSDASSEAKTRVKAKTALDEDDEDASERAEEEDASDDDDEYDSADSEDESNTISLLHINSHPVEYGEATTRLAVMNCDWQHMKAADVYALLQSFCPSGASVKRVIVYVSDFGKERLELEATLGPQAIWKQQEQEEAEQGARSSGADEEASNEMNEVRLRKYELEKFSYYFAVAECDTLATANTLYEQLNGIEVGYSSVQLDLRFVPDDVVFEGRTVRDKATNLPEEYSPPEFVSQALQSSKVRCTWDEPELERNQKLTNFTKWRDLKDSDFQVYLASESEEESETEATKAKGANLRKLLLAGDDDAEGGDGNGDSFFLNDGSDEDEPDSDDRIADFEKGWANAGPQFDDDEVVHEFSYVPKTKPTKADSKKKSKKGSKDQPQSEEKDDTEEAATRAANADGEVATTKGKKSKKGKSKKKRKAEEAAEEEGASAGIDVHDPRFSAVVEGDERFGIDRTDKSFKETDGMRALLAEQRKRKQQRLEKRQQK